MWRMQLDKYRFPVYTEHCYYEAVDIVEGKCLVHREETRDHLIKLGYRVTEEIAELPPPPPSPKLPPITPAQFPFVETTARVSILVPTFNRLSFTTEVLENLFRNTSPLQVKEVLIVDTGSTDGTLERVQEIALNVRDFKVRVISIKEKHVVATMVTALQETRTEYIAKIDSDTIVPPGWLEACLQVMGKHPDLTVLGLHSSIPSHIPQMMPITGYSYTPVKHIGGIGLFHRQAWTGLKPGAPPFWGWTGHQEEARWIKGWLNPPIHSILLDQLPFSPWVDLTAKYVKNGWQRGWHSYDKASSAIWQWKYPNIKQFKVVIPSANAENLKHCVESLFKCEPQLRDGGIIVIDDGARANYPDAPVTWVDGVKPFIFSRNINRGIISAGCDVILMNDDTTLITPGGFTQLATFMATHPAIGVCSTSIKGPVANPLQQARTTTEFCPITTSYLAFVCVYIPQSTFKAVGHLDERFSGYGRDDVDYCDRVRALNLQMGVYDPCIVQHHEGMSTFRKLPNLDTLVQYNQSLYQEKNSGRCVHV